MADSRNTESCSFCFFYENKEEFQHIEAGLGGRWAETMGLLVISEHRFTMLAFRVITNWNNIEVVCHKNENEKAAKRVTIIGKDILVKEVALGVCNKSKENRFLTICVNGTAFFQRCGFLKPNFMKIW